MVRPAFHNWLYPADCRRFWRVGQRRDLYLEHRLPLSWAVSETETET